MAGLFVLRLVQEPAGNTTQIRHQRSHLCSLSSSTQKSWFSNRGPIFVCFWFGDHTWQCPRIYSLLFWGHSWWYHKNHVKQGVEPGLL